ncbi:hypothetical protein B0T10DRAFT_539307 [Thelonectria olida]|uniref:Uncharacterized protein n=1 Tax=Thelonectria olida TaxID=1576542 RepID=A0A9P8VZN4_9HYPO|nr:hypothetical protein B0T10DRAFT_539307 [Thelonectria olida]
MTGSANSENASTVLVTAEVDPSRSSVSGSVLSETSAIAVDPNATNSISQSTIVSATAMTAAAEAASATATSTGTASPPPDKPGVPAGAVAGAAVGCLIAGLLFGFLGAFFLLRRRGKKQHSRSRHHEAPETVVINEKSSPTSAVSEVSGTKLDHFLLDFTPDKEIAQELRGLGDLIQLHVDNNYHLQPVQVSPSTLTQALLSLGLAPESANGVASLCIEPRTRALGLRHVISTVALASVDVNAKSPLSLLPAPIAAFLQSIPQLDGQSGGQPENTSLALSKWRALSAYLLHPERGERTPLVPTEATSLAQIQGLAAALNTAIGHFIDPAQRAGQMENLQAVLLDVAKFGYVLLSQPTDWGFVYEANHGREFVLVLRPGLQKLSHRDGRPYSSPPLVVAPDEAQLA